MQVTRWSANACAALAGAPGSNAHSSSPWIINTGHFTFTTGEASSVWGSLG